MKWISVFSGKVLLCSLLVLSAWYSDIAVCDMVVLTYPGGVYPKGGNIVAAGVVSDDGVGRIVLLDVNKRKLLWATPKKWSYDFLCFRPKGTQLFFVREEQLRSGYWRVRIYIYDWIRRRTQDFAVIQQIRAKGIHTSGIATSRLLVCTVKDSYAFGRLPIWKNPWFGEQDVFAFDITGRKLWQKRLRGSLIRLDADSLGWAQYKDNTIQVKKITLKGITQLVASLPLREALSRNFDVVVARYVPWGGSFIVMSTKHQRREITGVKWDGKTIWRAKLQVDERFCYIPPSYLLTFALRGGSMRYSGTKWLVRLRKLPESKILWSGYWQAPIIGARTLGRNRAVGWDGKSVWVFDVRKKRREKIWSVEG